MAVAEPPGTPDLAAYAWGSSGWLFPDGAGGLPSPDWVGGLVGKVLPAGYTMHTLRHRFATRAYRGSRNLRAVQTLLGACVDRHDRAVYGGG